MNMKLLLNLFLVTAAAVPAAFAQGFVQVSSISVSPKTLDCAQHSTAAVQVQVYFDGIKLDEPEVIVRLSIYSNDPPGNMLDLGEHDSEITLHQSPGLARFTIACSGETVPGKIKVAADIIAAPKGVQIARGNGDNNVVEVTIAKPK
jgi:hypothetical protein